MWQSFIISTILVNIFNPAIWLSSAVPEKVSSESEIVGPQKIIEEGIESLGVVISAASAIVVDARSGATLWEKNSDSVRPIASITKLMTALIFLDQKIDFNQKIIWSSDFNIGGEQLKIKTGTEITIRDIFDSMLVGSLNNCAVALAELSGLNNDEFVAAMNSKAKTFGLENTHFEEVTGLSADNVSTARELVKLLQIALDNPVIAGVTSLNNYRLNLIDKTQNYNIVSTNRLLDGYLNKNGYKIIGAKTGYIEESLYCIASEVANFAGNQVIVVILGSKDNYSRFLDSKAVTQWAFDNYKWEKTPS